ncbi:MAG: DUF418 domain-containing protein [Phycisphaerales bacterium]|nr:DUF418 domain-containing protein [Phycisphaerales bacterium]
MSDPAPGVPHPSPIGESKRLITMDAVRGLALLGILAMNIRAFAGPFATYMNPTLLWSYQGADKWAYRFTHVLFDTKMMSIFAMLFGAGVVVWSAKRSQADRPTLWLWMRRMFWLLIIGMVHAYLIWDGDILVPYALCGLLFLWWARRLPPWALLAIGLVMVCIGGFFWAGYGLSFEKMTPEQQVKTLAQMQPGPEELREEIAPHLGPYIELVKHRAPNVAAMQTKFFLMFFLWRSGGMMLVGAALMKLGFLSGRLKTGAYAAIALGGYALGLPAIIYGLAELERASFNFPQRTMLDLYNYFGSVLVAIAHAALVVLLIKVGVLGLLGRALAAVGQMAFTNYLVQSILLTTIFYGYGLGLYTRHAYSEQLLFVLGVWVLQLIISPLWLSRFHFGPFEWLWRTLTYMTPQPMRRAVPRPAFGRPTGVGEGGAP